MASSSRLTGAFVGSPHATGKQLGVPRPGGAGGAAWRPGVPHILLYSGDTVGASAWPLTQNLGYPAGAYTEVAEYSLSELANWPASTYVQPVSDRASGPVHINLFKSFSKEYALKQDVVWRTGEEWDPGNPDTDGFWDFIDAPHAFDWVEGWERFGHIGDWWLGDSTRIATTDMALTALAELDINVACIGGSKSEYHYPTERGMGWYNQTLDYWNWLMTRPDQNPDSVWNSPSWDRPSALPGDGWELIGSGEILVEGAGIAHLTGAVDDEGKNLGWSLYRYESLLPLVLESVNDFAARITADLLAHATRLGNSESFDVGFLMDDSGSFGGAQSRATETFLALIDSFRAAGKDIHVAMARYSDYAYRTHFQGSDEERPFSLQYPMAPVASDEARAALIDALETTLPGNGGGDIPETQWEAFYQIASGAGLDANHNGRTTDSGESGVKGPTMLGELTDEQADAYWPEGDEYELSQGVGYYFPGFSGDVPSFEGAVSQIRATATAKEQSVRSYRKDQ